MRKFLYIIIAGLLLIISPDCEAQIWPFKKRSQAEKASKDMEERKREAGEGNMFNPLQPFGSPAKDARDDHIWAPSTAATSYPGAGNISLTTPSRYGLKPGLDLLSGLGFSYWVPNLFLKNEISRDKVWVSSLHGIYTSYPGLNYVRNGSGTFLADSLSGVPLVLSIKNQLIFSRPFYSPLDCNSEKPYLVLSALVGIDYGFSFSEEDIYQENKHFFAPRSRAYFGEGGYLTLALRGDWEMLSGLFLRGEIRTMAGDYPQNIVFWEQQSSVELFLTRQLSLSLGYVGGYSAWNSNNFGLLPFFDLTVYFGHKKDRKRGLFGEQMF